MKDCVSIILPVYNIEKYIKETLDCVLAQTFENWELEITDDCSGDNTALIIQEYVKKDPRIHYWRLAKNSGAGIARNNSIEKATGRYLAFLDGDDWWYPTKLEEQLSFMQENNHEFTCTYYEDTDEKLQSYFTIKQPYKLSLNDIIFDCNIGTPGVIIDIAKIGKKFMPNLRRAEDWGFWLIILKDIEYLYTYPKVLWKYRHTSGSVSTYKFKQLVAVVKMYKIVMRYNTIKSWIFCIFIFLPKNILKKLKK